MKTPSLPDKIVAIHECLDRSKIKHAFGGALAYAYYGEPRTTIDIDLNLFIGSQRFSAVRQALDPTGITGEIKSKELEDQGQCRLWWGDTPIDLFFAYDPFHDAMRRQVRRVPFGDITLPILAPEHLIVCKAVFNRPKDWLDIEQMLVCVEHLDHDEIEHWITRIIGQDDARAKKLRRIFDELDLDKRS